MDKSQKDPEKIDLSVPRRAQYLHNAWKKHQDAVYWVDVDLAIRKGLTFYQTYRMQLSFKGYFQLVVFQKLLNWKLEKSYTRKRSCHLDHHQRSRYVTIGIKVKFHWALQLINNQKEKLFDSHKKKLLDEQNYSNQPNQSQKPIRVRPGQPDNTQDVNGVQKCPSEENNNVRVEQTHDGPKQPDKHNVAVQDDLEVYHEIKTLNKDNELIRERLEEDMNFNLPGLPHSTVKQL